MIVRKFMNWAQTASAGARAEGASALARAYLYADLSEDDFDDAELALTALLDDASPLVRRALAEAFASAADAPHHIVAALAADQSEVSTCILSRSLLLSDVELTELIRVSDEFAQTAIALRPGLSGIVCAELAGSAEKSAVVALAQNTSAHVADSAMAVMLARFGSDQALREALLLRPNLSLSLRFDITQAIAASLEKFVTGCGWVSEARMVRLVGEAQEGSAVLLAEGSTSDIGELVLHLQEIGALTPSMLLRSLLCFNNDIFVHAVTNLSQMRQGRVEGLISNCMGSGFAAIFARAGLPEALLPAFRAALTGSAQIRKTQGAQVMNRLSRPLIAFVIQKCSDADALDPHLLALLRRFEAEAARDVARHLTQTILQEERQIASAQRIGIAAIAAALDVPMVFEDMSVDDYHVVDYAEAA